MLLRQVLCVARGTVQTQGSAQLVLRDSHDQSLLPERRKLMQVQLQEWQHEQNTKLLQRMKYELEWKARELEDASQSFKVQAAYNSGAFKAQQAGSSSAARLTGLQPAHSLQHPPPLPPKPPLLSPMEVALLPPPPPPPPAAPPAAAKVLETQRREAARKERERQAEEWAQEQILRKKGFIWKPMLVVKSVLPAA